MSEQQEALTRWSIRPLLLEPMAGGAVNEHWRVETGRRAMVLRRYNPTRSVDGIPYEHDVLRFLKAVGWPVAPPLSTEDGEDVVVTEGGRWSLFPFLEGQPAPADEPIFLQRKAAVLALVQRDLAQLPVDGQRPGFGRVVDLTTPLRQQGFDEFSALIKWWGERDRPRAAALEGYREANLLALHARGYDGLDEWTVYGECLGNNVLFTGKDVTGLLDFDFVHRDARVADAARSLVVDCGADTDLVTRWLGGYAVFSDPPLSQAEADIIPDLMVANALWNIALPLSIFAHGGPSWMLESAQSDLDVLLPKLATSLPALRRITQAAAGYTTG